MARLYLSGIALGAPVLTLTWFLVRAEQRFDEQLLGRGLAEGTVEALPKPFTAQELVAKVSALLAGRR